MVGKIPYLYFTYTALSLGIEETMESQGRVADWCKRNYPESQKTNLLALEVLKEAVELCLAVGLHPESVIETAENQAYKTFENGNSEPFPGEAADVGINLLSFLEFHGLDLWKVIDAKMIKNRRKRA